MIKIKHVKPTMSIAWVNKHYYIMVDKKRNMLFYDK